MRIIYEDKDILACHKPAGLATQTARVGERDLYSEAKNHVGGAYIGIINRLDQPVEGIVLLAKNTGAATALEAMLKNGEISKYYRARVYIGDALEKDPESYRGKSGRVSLTDYMKKDPKSNLSRICDKAEPGAKRASLEYEVCEVKDKEALLNIRLLTGRHHQIRLQLSNAGIPILGDGKYASEKSRDYSRSVGIRVIQLCACKMVFKHPISGKELELVID